MAALLQGAALAIALSLWAVSLWAMINGAAARAQTLNAPRPGPAVVFDSWWEDGGTPTGGSKIFFDASKEGAARAEGLRFIGRYPFADGALYGCFEPEAMRVRGVWTQTSAVEPCAEPRAGRRIWGRFIFDFSPDGARFDGSWTSCDGPEAGVWDGAMEPTAIQMPDLRDPLALLMTLPRCGGFVS